MAEQLLTIRDLSVSVEDKQILHGIDLTVHQGETHVLMGPNGAGKSTLGYAVMGNPKYSVDGGSMTFQGKDLLEMSVDVRSREGIFLSFQNPIEIPGVTLENFIKNAVEKKTGKHIRLWDFKKQLKKAMEVLQMDPSYAERDLNVGFSGGEKKKAEILQLLMLKPALAILDETDSGLDVDAVRTVSNGILEFQKSQQGALLIITHSTRILNSLQVDATHVMVNGRLVASGGADMIDEINTNGFEQFLGDEGGSGVEGKDIR